MIILPDRNICRTKVLMPVPRHEWMTPSYAQPKTVFGHENRTLFRLRARLSDGHVSWQGWFEDRDDADAFLYAIVTGNLVNQPDIWRLPTPMWHPDFGVDVTFEFAVTSFLTTTGTANTYIVPSDWTSAQNRIHCIGGGASGVVVRETSAVARYAAGGGAGGYGSNENVALTGGASITYGVGVGGASVTRGATNGISTGNAGGDTYFNAASYAAATFGARGGAVGAGNLTSTNTAGGLGGVGKGTFSFTGGNGGDITAAGIFAKATGGGGAAGPNGNGNAGGSTSSAANSSTSGGSGDAGLGGAPGSVGGVSGSPGTEISGGRGSGGGGAGNYSISGSATGGSGGAYGAAGAASAASLTSRCGAGSQGIIILVYYPQIFSFNLAMMGM